MSHPELLLDGFLSYLQRTGRAEGTQQLYLGAARELLESSLSVPVVELSPAEVDQFLAAWRHRFIKRYGRPPRPSTYRNRVNALRAFFAWLERFDLLQSGDGRPLPNPMRRVVAPKPEQRRNDWLRAFEDNALLDAPATETEQVIVWLLRWTGLRVSEACALLVADVDLTPGRESVTVRKSKSAAGHRVVPIVPELAIVLQGWLAYRRHRDGCAYHSPLLAGRSGRALSSAYVWRLVKRVAARADVRPIRCTCARVQRGYHAKGCPQTRTGENVSEVSPHTLRRTFASDLLNRGLRLEVVSRLLGHASTTVTERAYAELLGTTARSEFLSAVQQPQAIDFNRLHCPTLDPVLACFEELNALHAWAA
jgi:integrase